MAMGEHVIEHVFELNRRLIRHVVAHALGKHGRIQRFDRELKEKRGVVDLLAPFLGQGVAPGQGGHAPEPIGAPAHLGHDRIEVQQRRPGAVAHHLVEHHIRPARSDGFEFGKERLLLNRNHPALTRALVVHGGATGAGRRCLQGAPHLHHQQQRGGEQDHVGAQAPQAIPLHGLARKTHCMLAAGLIPRWHCLWWW